MSCKGLIWVWIWQATFNKLRILDRLRSCNRCDTVWLMPSWSIQHQYELFLLLWFAFTGFCQCVLLISKTCVWSYWTIVFDAVACSGCSSSIILNMSNDCLSIVFSHSDAVASLWFHTPVLQTLKMCPYCRGRVFDVFFLFVAGWQQHWTSVAKRSNEVFDWG